MARNRALCDVARRSFLARIGAGLGVVGATFGAGQGAASAQSTGGGTFQPPRHTQDDWLDQVPGKHRIVFDTTTADGVGAALAYASNFFIGNQRGYGLAESDAAIVIVVRHKSTPYAYTDTIWAKYGGPLTARTGLNDPKTKQPAMINLLNTTGPGLPNRGTTVDSVIKRGVHFAVCQMATRNIAGEIAQATGGKVDDIYNELTANLVSNAHLVPAGIVAVNRAQEHGYTAATAVS